MKTIQFQSLINSYRCARTQSYLAPWLFLILRFATVVFLSTCFMIRKSPKCALSIPSWNNPFWSNCQMIPMLRAWSGSEDSLLSGSVIERHSSVCFVAFE